MSALSEALFDAFLAGFDASGEGFNGEYVAPKYRGGSVDGEPVENAEFLERMRKAFHEWSRNS